MNTTTITRTRRTRSPLVVAAAAIALLPGLLAGCSSSNADEGDRKSGGSAGQSATLAECMRGKGYDMPDPASGGTTMQLSAPEGVDPEQYQADLKDCTGDVGAAGDVHQAKPMEGMDEKRLESAKCIREGGFADYPDDEEGMRSYQPDDEAAFDEVARACDEKVFGSLGTGVGK